jgi:hypothetical protein
MLGISEGKLPFRGQRNIVRSVAGAPDTADNGVKFIQMPL